jgi:hypothetical protein
MGRGTALVKGTERTEKTERTERVERKSGGSIDLSAFSVLSPFRLLLTSDLVLDLDDLGFRRRAGNHERVALATLELRVG